MYLGKLFGEPASVLNISPNYRKQNNVLDTRLLRRRQVVTHVRAAIRRRRRHDHGVVDVLEGAAERLVAGTRVHLVDGVDVVQSTDVVDLVGLAVAGGTHAVVAVKFLRKYK